MAKEIDARAVKARLSEPGEIAFLDVREAGPYSEGHPFFSVPLAYSRLELDIERLVPCRSVMMVLFDQSGEGVAAKAAKRAEAMGYTNVHVMTGGAEAWQKAGYTLFSGVNVPSKTFGEIVEIERHTPRITAEDLVAMKAKAEDFVIVDGRTWAEYQRFNIPGGISCPNGELALRIGGIVPSPRTRIVVNCAGRTRSIIGAQTLIDFGVPNEVVALENGTQGWFLAGQEVQKGADKRYPAGATGSELEKRRERARALMKERGIREVDAATVAGWLADATRSTFVLDVRTAEEFKADALPGSVHAEGGQLIQATDQWVGVKGARLVLLDSEGVRAPMVAAWLVQLGHDAVVLAGGTASGLVVMRPAGKADATLPRLATITPAELAGMTATLLDLRASATYQAGHIPGAKWSIRPRITVHAKAEGPIVLVGEEPVARAAAHDLAAAGAKDIRLLAGGVEAWRKTGQPLATSADTPPDAERIDFIFHTHRRHDGDAEAARAYLAWEVGLVPQLDAQERGSFRIWRDKHHG